jgi:hypothetical protein
MMAMSDALRYWWLAFNDRTHDDGRYVTIDLGRVIVAAESFGEALQEARARGLHPGGAADGAPLKRGIFADPDVARRFTYRLLEGAEIGEAQLTIRQEWATLPDEPEPPLVDVL